MFHLLIAFCAASAALAQTSVSEPAAVRARAGAPSLADPASLAGISIAVLDNGFEGFVPGIGMLPASAELITGPVNAPQPTRHGLSMAQIAWAAAGNSDHGPKFYLVNANGLSNFKAAIDFVVERRVDIVLYARTWDYGGNFDGTGFVDALVGRAIAAGVTWVNAAGNHHGLVYDGTLRLSGSTARLPDAGQTLAVRTDLDDTTLTVSLSWNDFTSDDRHVSSKDLDLTLESPGRGIIARGERRQGVDPATDPQGTRFARETLTATVNRGTHSLRVTAFNPRAFGASDRLRILVTSNKPGSVALPSASNARELMPPADHPDVLTVGDGSAASAVGPTLDGRAKPELIIDDSQVTFTDGIATSGSSNAAAMVAGAAAARLAQAPTLRGETLRELITADSGRLTCLTEIPPYLIDSAVRAHLPRGFRATTDGNGRQVALIRGAPERLPEFAPEYRRGLRSPGQAFFMKRAPLGYGTGFDAIVTQVLNRADAHALPPGYVEVRQRAHEALGCP